MRTHLSQLQHKVDMASDAVSGLELASMRRYDVILVDEKLTNIVFNELVELIHDSSIHNQTTPIIKITYNPEQNSLHLQKKQIQCMKPFTRQYMLNIVELVYELQSKK
ncbi:response regulator [Legionella sp. PC997]|uniref:response regulator n=1 Tax=Legionella sp. PC997 TaxID=2755562 RepID=UPI001861817C|nr:response regulator [Legionella sp. PC997]QMT62067.1 response regulator [Legionella sp. PC997]